MVSDPKKIPTDYMAS